MQIKRGNAYSIPIPVKDSDGAAITNLASCTDIIFTLKKKQTDTDDDAALKKLKADMVVDTPATGTLTINLTSVDTLINKGKYFMGLQLNYSDTNKLEINLADTNGNKLNTITVLQDTVRG